MFEKKSIGIGPRTQKISKMYDYYNIMLIEP